MNLKDFPFRLKGPQDEFLTTLSLLLFTDPGGGVFSAPSMEGVYPKKGGNDFYNFTAIIKPTRVEVTVYVLDIAQKDPALGEWLNKYHTHLERSRGITMKVNKASSVVRIHYSKESKKDYYMWYIAANEDNVPLTGLPFGEWFATERY